MLQMLLWREKDKYVISFAFRRTLCTLKIMLSQNVIPPDTREGSSRMRCEQWIPELVYVTPRHDDYCLSFCRCYLPGILLQRDHFLNIFREQQAILQAIVTEDMTHTRIQNHTPIPPLCRGLTDVWSKRYDVSGS